MPDTPSDTGQQAGWDAEAMAWLDKQPRYERPTEIHVPVVEGVGPMWLYQERRGCWYAYLAFAVELPFEVIDTIDGRLAECQHHHATPDEAWACASDLARTCAEAVLAR